VKAREEKIGINSKHKIADFIEKLTEISASISIDSKDFLMHIQN